MKTLRRRPSDELMEHWIKASVHMINYLVQDKESLVREPSTPDEPTVRRGALVNVSDE
jgi:hypothetical protein